MLASMMLPGQILMVPQYLWYEKLGWVGSFAPLIVPFCFAIQGFFVYLMMNFIQGIPRELDEAAKIDGAGEFAVFARVILPMLKPVLTVVGLFAFTGSWNDFLWPTIVFNDVGKMPLTAGLQLLNGAYGSFQLGPILAAACVAILPTFLLYLFAQKYFLQSMALHSGVKG